MAKKPTPGKTVTALKHDEAARGNIPTAEYQSAMQKQEQAQAPVRVAYPRGAAGLEEEKEHRNLDLDPQLVWRGKDQQDWSDLVVHAPPLCIQEKVHPKELSTTCCARPAAASTRPGRRRQTCLPTSTAFRRAS
jgi:adenine-specific DNA-methyltransferase